MRILLTNDDGINAEGINTLAKELEKDHEVIIAAPDDQRSAMSHSITLTKPITVKKVELEGIKSKAYSVSGTPADCVRVALDKLVNDPIDMVVSGINMGVNLGMDILYSGTVSAAIEANIYKIPSIAVSAEMKDGCIDYHIGAKFIRDILEKSKDNFIKNHIVLNINTPYIDEDKIKGTKICKIGSAMFDYYFMEDNDINDEVVLKVKGRRNNRHEEGTDRYYINEGYVTITPLHYDLTNFHLLEEVKNWFQED